MRRVAIIGATGKVARHALTHALEQGFVVHALARTPENLDITHEHLKVFQGDVRDKESLKPAIEGTELVLSCIGNRSKDKGEVIELGTRNIIEVMKQVGVKRLALISSVGVGDSAGQLTALGIRGLVFGAMFFTMMNKLRKDLLHAEQAAMESGLDVVVVRPVELTKETGVGSWKATHAKDKKLGGKIARADVGAFLVSLIDDKQHDGKAVSLGAKP